MRLLIGILIWAALCAPALAADRVALLIGNGDYRHTSRLKSPPADVGAMGAALEALGFEVETVTDADRRKMGRAIRNFTREARKADTALLYYSGHGMEIRGRNYLVPVDAQLEDEADAGFEAIGLPDVIAAASGAKRLSVVVLDACRDNRFASATKSGAKGFRPIRAQPGQLIAFATAPGTVAYDGGGALSPFTQALTEALTDPTAIGLDVRQLFGGLGPRTSTLAKGPQEPFTHAAGFGRASVTLTGFAVPPAKPTPGGTGREAAAQAAYEAVKDRGDADALALVAAQFPGTFWGKLAARDAKSLQAPQTEATDGPADAVATTWTPPVSAAECENLVLGAAISLTGKYAVNGIHTKNGYAFAIQKIKDAGGVRVGPKCYNFKVIYYDDESRGDRAATLAERLINFDNVQYMLGPYSSGITNAIAPVTEKYKIPMVEAEGASQSLFKKGYKRLFAVHSTSEQYLASAVTLAAELAERQGHRRSDVKVAVAVENDPFSLDVRAGVLAEAKKFGMKIVVDEKLPRDLSDMTAILTKVKLTKPDVLIITGHSKGAATAVRQISEQKIATPLIAMTHCEAANVTGNFGRAANDILCATQWAETLAYRDPIFGSATNYEKEFKAAFPEYRNKTVPYQTAQASAAVYVFKDAFERAGSLDKEHLRDAIAATDLTTFFGRIKFSPAGNNIAKPMVLRQIQNGSYNVVAPTAFAPHRLNYPRTPK